MDVAKTRKTAGMAVICADNDHETTHNPGITKGKEAAEILKCGLAYPEGICGTDWDDADRSGAREPIHAQSGSHKEFKDGDIDRRHCREERVNRRRLQCPKRQEGAHGQTAGVEVVEAGAGKIAEASERFL